MTTAQKIIKNIALAFAALLIFSIISGILSAIYALSGVLGLQKENSTIKEEMSMIDFENSDVAILDIDVAFTNLTIKNGDLLIAETNNKDINCKQNNQSLQIKENKNNLFSNNEGDLVIYIPEELKFEKVKINAGAGQIQIEDINTEKLFLELGAGETVIKNLNVTKECEIESGAGKVSILEGNINKLNLDMGVGKFEVNSAITGSSKINAGIGNLELIIQGDKEDYTIKTSKGIGTIEIDGKDIADNEIYGNGENDIKIDGGIGEIKIDFKN